MSYLSPSARYTFLAYPPNRSFKRSYSDSAYLWLKLCHMPPHLANPKVLPCALAGNADMAKMSIERAQYMNFLKVEKYLLKVLKDCAAKVPPQLLVQPALVAKPAFVEGPTGTGSGRRGRMMTMKGARASQLPITPPRTGQEPPPRRPRAFTGGVSEVTRRLLGVGKPGTPSLIPKSATTIVNPNARFLPWTSVVNTIINWMSFYGHVEGIVGICLGVLPSVLDDEVSRSLAQRASLSSLVFKAMVAYRGSTKVVMGCFHTLVLLARPMGGVEGGNFHNSMIYPVIGHEGGGLENGVGIILKTMKSFMGNGDVLAMGSWSLVNISLNSTYKKMLMHLGGIELILAAIDAHPLHTEVVYRCLFALINIVIPPSPNDPVVDPASAATVQELLGGSSLSQSEMQWNCLNRVSDRVVVCVVTAMSRHMQHRDIMGRGVLILHNMSLTPVFHRTLVMNGAIDMLKECHRLYRGDNHLIGYSQETLYRLFTALNENARLKAEFIESQRGAATALTTQAVLSFS